MIRYIILVVVAWFFAPELQAQIGSMPNLSDLAQAEVIIHAHAADVQVTAKVYDEQMVVKNADILKGVCPRDFVSSGQTGPLPKGATSYLIFLRKTNGKIVVQNETCSVIGIGESVKIAAEDCGSKKVLLNLLGRILIRESVPDCAALQSYLLSDCGKEKAENIWSSFDRSQTNPEIYLANVNIGLHAVGAVALDQSNLATIQKYFANSSPSYYARKVERSIVTWTSKNASEQGSPSILHYALVANDSSKADILAAVAPVLSPSSLPSIISLFKHTKEPNLVQYTCIQAILYILNDGRDMPAIDLFLKNPQLYTTHAIKLLQEAGYGESLVK